MERAYRADDVRAAEEPLLAAGEPLMDRAAYAVAQRAIRYLRESGQRIPGSTALALVGSGNNGGDALFAAANLARRGLSCRAALLGTPHEAGLAAARAAGVGIIDVVGADVPEVELSKLAAWGGIWIDGILGIGVRGAAREPIAGFLRLLDDERRASAAEPFVIAVDVPSGIGVDDGTLPGPALRAHATVAMGCAKPGLLLPPAARLAGEIDVVELGFSLGAPAVLSLGDADVADLWDVPGVDDHKYTRGVLGMHTGSGEYPGAAVLGVGAALATGPGMVRYLGEAKDAVVGAHPETVTAPGRIQALVIGSGQTQVSDEASHAFQEALAEGIPVVLDAGAIELVHFDDVPSTVVITPHAGELTLLLNTRGEKLSRAEVEAAPARAVRLAAALTGATVVLKGATDLVAAPDGPLFAQSGAPGWRATAGAGDVLAGVIGALLAGYGDEIAALGHGKGIPAMLAAGGCHLHARAADLAADGGPIAAGDIGGALPATIREVLK